MKHELLFGVVTRFEFVYSNRLKNIGKLLQKEPDRDDLVKRARWIHTYALARYIDRTAALFGRGGYDDVGRVHLLLENRDGDDMKLNAVKRKIFSKWKRSRNEQG